MVEMGWGQSGHGGETAAMGLRESKGMRKGGAFRGHLGPQIQPEDHWLCWERRAVRHDKV